jgi:hypothetical protein
MTHEAETVLHIVTADQSTLKCYDCVLLVLCDMDFIYPVILRDYIQAFHEFMRSK